MTWRFLTHLRLGSKRLPLIRLAVVDWHTPVRSKFSLSQLQPIVQSTVHPLRERRVPNFPLCQLWYSLCQRNWDLADMERNSMEEWPRFRYPNAFIRIFIDLMREVSHQLRLPFSLVRDSYCFCFFFDIGDPLGESFRYVPRFLPLYYSK